MKNKASNDWIRAQVKTKTGSSSNLTLDEMKAYLAGKGQITAEAIIAKRPVADRELNHEDILAISEYMTTNRTSWKKAREFILAQKVEASAQHPMSKFIRAKAGK